MSTQYSPVQRELDVESDEHAPENQRASQQAEALAQLACLRLVPLSTLSQLASLCTLRAIARGTRISNEQVGRRFLYVVLRGTLSLTLHDRLGHEVRVGTITRGDAFGEGPLFGDLFRGTSAQAETDCYLLQVPLVDVRTLVGASAEFKAALRTTYHRRLIESSLGRVPLFSRLAPADRTHLATLLRPREYERNALIIQEGTVGESLYIIESGQVTVERNGNVIAHLDEGTFFGEMSLLSNEPHNADVRALTPAEVLVLPAADFLNLLEQQPALAAELQKVVERRRQAGVRLINNPERAEQLAVAVDRGLLRGTHLLVRDSELCEPNCRLCEQACADRHGYARLHLPGVQVNGMDVADACRQCRFGAECVEACPEDAIQWNDRGALFITDACTGCGACVPACPYDAMQRVPLPTTHRSPLWWLWQKAKQRRAGVIMLETNQQTHRADKCDLCHGHGDLACVSACPTGALQLVPLQEVLPL